MPNKHCLIVDDSDLIRRVAKQLLTVLQFDTSEAVDGADALARCSTAMPDVILLDWSMPAPSGLDCLQALRLMSGGDRPVIVYCTTENDPLECARARLAGADDVLVKPYDREMLRAKFIEAGLI